VSETIVVSASVVTEDQSQAARAAEVLARAAAGLVLEGISVSVSLSRVDDEEDPS
jgi:hypothetical protein